eukprot:m.32624 g.32624  ORF g.32624 m.32624 type:complete len:83 (+) comp9534_c0_seq1:221-469(+)
MKCTVATHQVFSDFYLRHLRSSHIPTPRKAPTPHQQNSSPGRRSHPNEHTTHLHCGYTAPSSSQPGNASPLLASAAQRPPLE